MRKAFLAALLCLACTIECVSAPLREEQQFLADAAYDKMMNASSTEEMLVTAGLFRKLVASGVRSGPIFYNMGSAFLAGGDAESALAAFERAERYVGSNADLKGNILAAQKLGTNSEDAVLPWYRVPLFWHYGISFRIRLAAAAISFMVLWVLLALRIAGSRRNMTAVAVLAGILLGMFGSSAATSAAREYTDRKMDYMMSLSGGGPHGQSKQ